MENRIVVEKEIELLGEKYIAYLKRVPTRISKRRVISTAVKAFIRRMNSNHTTRSHLTQPHINTIVHSSK